MTETAPPDNQRGAMLIMARHGATNWNEQGRYQGRADPALSAAGRLAAQGLAVQLAGVAISEVVASPLARAVETARLVARPHGLSVRIDPALIEIDYGAWEGLTQPEVKQRWPDLLRQWKHMPGLVRFPGGETLAEARARLGDFLVRAPPCGGRVVITHQTIIRLAWLKACGRPDTDFRVHKVETAVPVVFLLQAPTRDFAARPTTRRTAAAPPRPEAATGATQHSGDVSCGSR